MWSSYGHYFSKALRQARQARGLSQQALADIAGVSRSQICNLERNNNGHHAMADPQLSTVYKLAQALEIPPGSLIPAVTAQVGSVCAPAADAEWTRPAEPSALQEFPVSYIEQRRYESQPWA